MDKTDIIGISTCLPKLKSIWDESVILKIFIREWDKYEEICTQKLDSAEHISIILNAYRNNQLNHIIHSFTDVLASDLSKLRKQYQNDLHERWLLKKDPEERNKYFKIFYGKFIEIMFAHYLKSKDWVITNLEAWDEHSSDIEAKCPEKKSYSIDVKYIGTSDQDFSQFLNSETGCFARFGDINYEYVYFKIYECYKNKKSTENKNIAAIIIDPTFNPVVLDWFKFVPPTNTSDEINKFLESKSIDPSQYLKDLQDALNFFDEIGIYIYPEYRFELQKSKKRLPEVWL